MPASWVNRPMPESHNGISQKHARTLSEANPMAMLVESAGGLAIDNGHTRIRDIKPTNIHQRTGVILGSKEEVEKFIQFTKA